MRKRESISNEAKPRFTEVKLGVNTHFQVPAHLSPLYEIKKYERLGSGNFGTVLKFNGQCGGSNHNPAIAIKYFTAVFENVKRAKLALRELNLLNHIRHHNVVRILGAYVVEDEMGQLQSVYHITAYCGKSLKCIIENERYTMKQVQSMMSDLLRACKYLNSAGVIHRDIKPDNMCIDENWKLTLLDLGLARVIDRNNPMTDGIGTHSYMSIEMLEKWTGRYDEKVDVWSIGAILCELLTGEILFGFGDIVKNPFEAAIRKCGPIPEVVLQQIGEDDDAEAVKIRDRFREKSRIHGIRIDFSTFLKEEGRTWLADEIELNKEQLVNFIEYALQYEQEMRMSVDFALTHHLLGNALQLSREAGHQDTADAVVPNEQPLPEDVNEAMIEVKKRIIGEINTAPKFLE